MRELHEWFWETRRDFPWREHPTPYKVWISEVMLQQTRAAVVVPYFERWLRMFPNVEALANASLDQVIKAWEGLGYYSRARNLHKGAEQIVKEFGGKIPSSKKDLETIHGIGPYTLGAILSFGFRQKAAAVDGNVMRVMSRYLRIEENVSKQAVKQKISAATEELLDADQPWITMEALIELGATVCTPKPKCSACPLQAKCLGQSIAESLPIKSPSQETIKLKRTVLLIEAEGHLLVKKGEKGKVMEGLYEFPYFDHTLSIAAVAFQELGLSVTPVEALPTVSHTFTRYKAFLHPVRCKIERMEQVPGYSWVLESSLTDLPFSSGHRKIKRS